MQKLMALKIQLLKNNGNDMSMQPFHIPTYYYINLLSGAAAPPSDVEVTVQSSKSILVQWGPI